MKKILLVLVSVILLLTLLIFIFIPGKLVITESRIVNSTGIGFDSCLHKPEKWKQWWPGTSGSAGKDSLFTYDGYTYKLSGLYTDGADIQISSGKTLAETRIQTIFRDRDSIFAAWSTVLQTGINPLKRLSMYGAAGKLKKNMKVVFDSLCHFAGKTENIYGYHIERTTFTEVNLIAYRFNTVAYPSTAVIYNAINRLGQYLVSQGAAERYYPMMNTKRVDSSHYETMIAISINRVIPENGEFFLSQMVAMKDRFLTTDVSGGQTRIDKARQSIEKYMEDHSLSAPARPFDILVTDRSKITDTNAWKTKIFYPSM